MTIPAEFVAKIVDPKAYADGSIFDVYKWLRANDPLPLIETEGYQPFRLVTRYADLQNILRRNAEFYNGPQAVLISELGKRKSAELSPEGPMVKTLISMDGEEHQKYRALTSAWFQPGNLKKLEGRIREIARSFVDRMGTSGGRCDFVNEIALHYPLLVIMEILGLPEEDEPLMLKLTQEMFGSNDPDLNERGNDTFSIKDEKQELDQSMVLAMIAYFAKLTAQRRAEPSADLASVIANARIDDEPLPDRSTLGYYIITATAGHDTTSSSTSGAVWALAERPDQFRQVKDDLSLIPSLVDEAIRWMTPVKHFMRRSVADTEVNGRRIAQDEWLMICFASANRDESVFEDPDLFRLDRKPNRHVAFGYGGHLCLGQYLARIEMRILFEELLPRLQSLELDGEPAMSRALFVNGPKRLPIRFTMN